MEIFLIPIVICGMLFLGLPWILFHYITRWKTQATLTREDESLLDELHELAGQLEERVSTVERIMTADNPQWRSLAGDPAPVPSDDPTPAVRRINP